jgi:hypothetical protein
MSADNALGLVALLPLLALTGVAWWFGGRERRWQREDAEAES